MRFLRYFVADRIVYQSGFVREWWNKRYGSRDKESSTIYNGVDLTQFNPEGPRYLTTADVCIISVEGNQGADPFNIAIELGQRLKDRGLEVEMLMFGNSWRKAEARFTQYKFVRFLGQVPNSELPYFYRGATFHISTDIIAACPNSVIEALACGTPVLGYELGALPEMVTSKAGRCVPAEGDPLKGERVGNTEGLIKAALEILENIGSFRVGARSLAERRYGLDPMVERYFQVLFR
jgi:glycosyltransferase involved in cell wall biosynthesis